LRFPWVPLLGRSFLTLVAEFLTEKGLKAVQIGGPSGGCIPEEHLDTVIDYDSLISLGAMMGSGGLVVMDEDTCMVNVAKFFLEFIVDEFLWKVCSMQNRYKRECWKS